MSVTVFAPHLLTEVRMDDLELWIRYETEKKSSRISDFSPVLRRGFLQSRTARVRIIPASAGPKSGSRHLSLKNGPGVGMVGSGRILLRGGEGQGPARIRQRTEIVMLVVRGGRPYVDPRRMRRGLPRRYCWRLGCRSGLRTYQSHHTKVQSIYIESNNLDYEKV